VKQRLLEFEADVTVIVLADANGKDFIKDRQNVVKRADRLKYGRIRWVVDTSSSGEKDGILDSQYRIAAIMKLGGQDSIIASDDTGGARHLAIGVENLLHVLVFGHDAASALRIT
jgi:hypothetical protein